MSKVKMQRWQDYCILLLASCAGGYCRAGGGRTAYDVLETYKGKDLEFKEYEPLFDCAVERETERKRTMLPAIRTLP